MARKRKTQSDPFAHLRVKKAPNIVNPPRRKTKEELEIQENQRRQAGYKGKSSHANREKERKRRDRKEEW